MCQGADRVARIRETVTLALTPEVIEITDDSHLHAGHAGARSGKGHFTLRVVADAFTGLSLIDRHRMIYAALGDLMQSDIHALSIIARAPGERD